MLVIPFRIGYKKFLGLDKQKKTKSMKYTSNSDINNLSQDTKACISVLDLGNPH